MYTQRWRNLKNYAALLHSIVEILSTLKHIGTNMNPLLKHIAYNSGIRFDSFGSPVIDKEAILQDFVKAFIVELHTSLPPKAGSILAVAVEKYNIYLK
jgi:hypothetical protein